MSKLGGFLTSKFAKYHAALVGMIDAIPTGFFRAHPRLIEVTDECWVFGTLGTAIFRKLAFNGTNGLVGINIDPPILLYSGPINPLFFGRPCTATGTASS